MAKIIKRAWTSRGPSGHKVKRVAYGFTAQVDGKQERRFAAEWDRETAQDELAKFLLERDKPKATPITLAEAQTRYEQAKARKQTLAGDRLIFKRLLAHFGAATRLDKITAEAISLYRDGRLTSPSERRKDAAGTPTPLAAGTVNRELALVRHLLRLAHDEWGALAVVPRIRLAKEPEGRIRWLEPEEERALHTACAASKTAELAPLVTLALETGMRYSEILGLTWERVDLSRGVLRLEGRGRGGDRTKSGKRREVPMRQAVYNLLAARPAPREGRVWPARSIRTAFENAVAVAKLDDFVFHDCRHHFASWFMMRGGSLQALQKILAISTQSAHEAAREPQRLSE